MKKKIVWVTANCFIDVDLPILPLMSEKYEIEWFVIYEKSIKIDYQSIIHDKIKNSDIKLVTIQLKSRIRNPFLFIEYLFLLSKILKPKPSLFYIDISGMPYFLPLLKMFVDSKRVVVATHNVSTPKGAANQNLAKQYMRFTLKVFNNLHVFSESQKIIIVTKYPKKNILFAPLALKDFGKPNTIPDNIITFLNFGIISEYKRVDVLIQAAIKAYEKTGKRFIVKIAGACNDWSKYQELIKYPFLFDLRIESIPNEDIPNLFASSHYFVLPYQDIAQSGALTVAFNYNLPVLASNLEGFREYINHERTGFLFETASVDALSELLVHIIKNHNFIYSDLKENQLKFVQENYVIETIAKKYSNFFESLLV